MTTFEQSWYVKYMNNMVTTTTLNKLITAGKLNQLTVDLWVKERLDKFGY